LALRSSCIEMKRLVLILISATAVLFSALLLAGAGDPSLPDDPAAMYTIERARLAQSGQYYLELHLGAKNIQLCHSGVAIATYPLHGIAVGLPRVFFFSLGSHKPWIGAIWTKAQLDPPRVVERVKIVPGDESTIPTPDVPGVIPPTMDELIAVPSAYKIRFEGGQTLIVNLEGQIPGAVQPNSRHRDRWRDFLAALGLRKADFLRISVSVPGKDGAALYRSFPEPPPQMLVLP
jgi:hypothetical protein